MEIKIKTKKYSATIVYNNDKDLILKSGAVLGAESPSLDNNLKQIRKAIAVVVNGMLTTNTDYRFTSKSAIASMLVGSPQSGNRFFAKYLGNSTTQGSSTTENNAQSENTTTTTENKPNENIIWNDKSKTKLFTDFKVFCKDFGFNVDPRCMNTMLYQNDIDSYILNFMQVIGFDDSMLAYAKKKFSSPEWKDLVRKLKTITPSHPAINKRLVVLYGSPGTGKTTYAIQQYGIADTSKVDENGNPTIKNMVIASASADPDEIFTRFNPVSKKYELSPIGEAMQNGTPIIIDEANFYCSEVLKRLQGVTDKKNSITDNNIDITIKDGFKIVITMNLDSNIDGKRPLSDALVSRAEHIDNYDNHPNANFGWIF